MIVNSTSSVNLSPLGFYKTAYLYKSPKGTSNIFNDSHIDKWLVG
jgi:hypothetical protein